MSTSVSYKSHLVNMLVLNSSHHHVQFLRPFLTSWSVDQKSMEKKLGGTIKETRTPAVCIRSFVCVRF